MPNEFSIFIKELELEHRPVMQGSRFSPQSLTQTNTVLKTTEKHSLDPGIPALEI